MDCPFIDARKSQCSEHLNMGNLQDAFALCTDKYYLCGLYLTFTQSSLEPTPAKADSPAAQRVAS